jgi:hypothetical protein
MTTYSGSTTLEGSLDPDTGTFTTTEVLNMPTHATGDFTPGGTVTVPEYEPGTFTYVGYGPDGWIGTSDTWGTVYFTKTSFADAPTSFSYETGAFPYYAANVTAGGTIDPDTLTFTVDEVTNMPTEVMGDFAPGGILSVREYEPPDFDYVGYGPNGWIGYSEDWGYVYFTTDAFADVPASFTYATGTFVVCFLAGTLDRDAGGRGGLIETLADRRPRADGRRPLPRRCAGSGRQTVVTAVRRPAADVAGAHRRRRPRRRAADARPVRLAGPRAVPGRRAGAGGRARQRDDDRPRRRRCRSASPTSTSSSRTTP